MKGVAFAAALIVFGAQIAFAFNNEPQGFGPLRFGMSAAAAKQALPEIKSKGSEEFLALYELENQSVLGLHPCHVELQFIDDRLYEVGFRCEPKDKVVPALEKHFGAPVQHGPGGTVWLSEKRSVVLNPQSKAFSYSDRPLSIVAQRKLFGYVLRQRAQAQAHAQATAAVPSPPPTP
jgi:hypothetical protein